MQYTVMRQNITVVNFRTTNPQRIIGFYLNVEHFPIYRNHFRLIS